MIALSSEELLCRERVDRLLADLGRPLVAFSGGVDSALLVARAAEVGGGAATLVGAMYASEETTRARDLAVRIGLPHFLMEVDSLADGNIRSNPLDRCYHCRRLGMGRIVELARREGYGAVVDGENADDAADYRPGVRAMRELGMRAPLREAGMTKAMIRRWSAELNLPTAELPAAACLASRFPFGIPLSEEALRQVEESEVFLRELGLRQVRVRHHVDTARIETGPEDIATLAAPENRERVVKKLTALGYRRVTVDLAGYRTGSFNPDPPPPE